jgi:hypothetical protein
MNLQLPSEHQRLFVLIGVGVVALAGLFLVTRSGGGETGSPSTPPAKTSPAQTSPTKPGTAKSEPPKSGSGNSNSTESQSATKPSKQAYLNCVEQATDAAALEKCQALVP